MIRDLDASIVTWLSELVPYAATGVQAVVEDPGESDRLRLSLVLVDVREDPAASTHLPTRLRSDEGVVVGQLGPERRYRFTYVLSAFAAEPLDEHAALGSVLAGAAQIAVLPTSFLRGAMTDCAGSVFVRVAPYRDEADHDRWPSWRVAGRLALELEVLAPLPDLAAAEVAEPPSRIELHTSGALAGRRQPNGSGAPTPRRPKATITEG